MEGGAARQVGALDEHDVAPAELRQPVEDRAAADAATDHDHASAVTHDENLSYDPRVGSDLDFALALADVADEITMRHFRSPKLEVESKADLTPVSVADRAAEEALRDAIARERPGEAVVGEELGADGDSAARWILDPIDGTKHYVRGIPLWATLIALERDGGLAAAVVSAPALGTRWWAARGEGAFANGHRIHVSSVPRLDEAAFSHAGAGASPSTVTVPRSALLPSAHGWSAHTGTSGSTCWWRRDGSSSRSKRA